MAFCTLCNIFFAGSVGGQVAAALPVHARRVRRHRASRRSGVARHGVVVALRDRWLHGDRGRDARPVVVLHDEPVADVVVEGHLDPVLGVEAEPLPAVEARAAEVAGRVDQAGVLDRLAAVAPVREALRELVGALRLARLVRLGRLLAVLCGGALVAGAHDALAARVAVGRVVLALRDPLAGRALAGGAGDVEHLRVDVDERAGGVHAAAGALEPRLDVDRVARVAGDGRRVELVVAGGRGLRDMLLVLARVVVKSVETHSVIFDKEEECEFISKNRVDCSYLTM
jgi:hypothetical protein